MPDARLQSRIDRITTRTIVELQHRAKDGTIPAVDHLASVIPLLVHAHVKINGMPFTAWMQSHLHDPHEREFASWLVRRLASPDNPAVINLVAQMLTDEEVWVRDIAVQVVQRNGALSASTSVIRALIHMFVEQPEKQGRLELFSLLKRGFTRLTKVADAPVLPEIISDLDSLLAHDTTLVRLSAARLLHQLSPSRTDLLAALVPLMQHEDHDVAGSVVDAMAEFSDAASYPEVIETLGSLLHHPNDEMCAKAARALGEMGPRVPIRPIIADLRTIVVEAQRTEDVRLAALISLANLKFPLTVDIEEASRYIGREEDAGPDDQALYYAREEACNLMSSNPATPEMAEFIEEQGDEIVESWDDQAYTIRRSMIRMDLEKLTARIFGMVEEERIAAIDALAELDASYTDKKSCLQLLACDRNERVSQAAADCWRIVDVPCFPGQKEHYTAQELQGSLYDLIKDLVEADPLARQEALKKLATLGYHPGEIEIVPDIVEAVCVKCFYATLGKKLPSVEQVMGYFDIEVRCKIIGYCTRLLSETRRTSYREEDFLIKSIDLILALGVETWSPENVAKLNALLFHKDHSFRHKAAEAISIMGGWALHKDAILRLVAKLRSGKIRIQAYYLSILGTLGPVAATTELIDAVIALVPNRTCITDEFDVDTRLGISALKALVEMNVEISPDLYRAIIELFESPDETVLPGVLNALSLIGPEIITPSLLDCLGKTIVSEVGWTTNEQDMAQEVLGEMILVDLERVSAFLQYLFSHNDKSFRSFALSVITDCRLPASIAEKVAGALHKPYANILSFRPDNPGVPTSCPPLPPHSLRTRFFELESMVNVPAWAVSAALRTLCQQGVRVFEQLDRPWAVAGISNLARGVRPGGA